MISTIIGAIVTLLCWAKVSKDTEEQTQLASWTKTGVLAVLTIVVLVFYLKTYQVKTITNYVNIHDYKSCVDSSGNILDTIKLVRITNKFSSGITENLHEEKLKKTKDERSSIELGSVYIAHQLVTPDPIKKQRIKYNAKNLKDQGKDTLDKFLEVPISDYNHIYDINYLRTSVPSLIPLLPSFVEKENIRKDNLIGVKIYGSHNSLYSDEETRATKRNINPDGSIDETEASKKLFDNAFAGVSFYGDIGDVDSVSTSFVSFYSNIANTFNFFTAADISQYTQAIDITSDCYVEKLTFMYDIPIGINPYDSCMTVFANSFSVRGKCLNDNIVKGYGLQFHVMLPTLANLQLIRSLILTTLLTALAALLLANIFYLFRKYSVKYIEEHKDQISELKLKKFKKKIYILLVVVFATTIYITIKIYKEEAFHIPMNVYSFLWQNYEWIFLGIIILMISIICFFFKNVISLKKKNNKNKTSK